MKIIRCIFGCAYRQDKAQPFDKRPRWVCLVRPATREHERENYDPYRMLAGISYRQMVMEGSY